METSMLFSIRAGSRQRGATLLEALIGILIFSVGILALVGMQALAIKHMSDAKYRSDAAFFANAAGALATTRPGAQPSMPHRTEVDALLTATRAAP